MCYHVYIIWPVIPSCICDCVYCSALINETKYYNVIGKQINKQQLLKLSKKLFGIKPSSVAISNIVHSCKKHLYSKRDNEIIINSSENIRYKKVIINYNEKCKNPSDTVSKKY